MRMASPQPSSAITFIALQTNKWRARRRNILFFFLLLFITPAFAMTQDTYPFTSTADADRFTALTKEIRCVVCQNQNIADSHAPLANDLRYKVYQMVLANKADAEIKQYLVKRYGDFILLKPPFHLSTALLWLFPLLGLFGLLFIVKSSY